MRASSKLSPRLHFRSGVRGVAVALLLVKIAQMAADLPEMCRARRSRILKR